MPSFFKVFFAGIIYFYAKAAVCYADKVWVTKKFYKLIVFFIATKSDKIRNVFYCVINICANFTIIGNKLLITRVKIFRRKRCLQDKHDSFVNLGLMEDNKERYQLIGGEFVSLYLRFFYETRKHGKLSRKLIFGKGPPTLFGETTEKLVRSLAYHLTWEGLFLGSLQSQDFHRPCCVWLFHLIL